MKSLFSLILSTGRKKPKTSTLERSLCKQVFGGSGMSTGNGPKNEQASATQEKPKV
ncbi:MULTISPECIES: hypothetical protein [Pseudoalteromonas]|uniref:hypothetical protein n=1 Tax=Pseudoalteromonas TaxID=53246 RepID=UPI0002F92EED|nr:MULTISPECIES: hypothetical protein [Pseudoalteromonas]